MFRFFFTYFLSTSAFANVGGTDLHNFNPTSNGLDYITVHSSDTLDSTQINFGAFLTYVTNSLAYSTINATPNSQTFTEPNDRLLYSDIHLGFGIIQGWDIGVNASFTNSQSIETSDFLFTYGNTGLNDIRLNTKVRLYKSASTGFAFIGGVDFEQVSNNPFAGDNSGPAVNFEAAFDTYLTSALRWAVNVGYRLRQEGTSIPNTGVTPIPDQMIYSSALSYAVSDAGSAILAEIYGSYPTEIFSLPTDREQSNLEALFGFRWRTHKKFDLHFGVGTEIYHGLGSPDMRAFLGFNWRFATLTGGSSNNDIPVSEDPPINDTDADAVPDGVDQCPNTKLGTLVDETGCATQPVDYNENDQDNDGVNDEFDQCPNTVSGTQVNDLGCDANRVEDIVLSDLNFKSGTASLTTESREKFDSTMSKIRDQQSSIQKIVIEGHSDSVGKAPYNKKLSQSRAEKIKRLLLHNTEIQDHQIQAIGYGEERPVADNSSSYGRAQNRRVELRIIK